MRFDHPSDQQALADSIARQAAVLFPFDANRRRGQTLDVQRWQRLGTLGWHGLTVPDELGGLGQPLLAAMPILEALGGASARQPCAETLVAARVLRGTSLEARRAGLVDGGCRLVVAHREPGQAAMAVDADTLASLTTRVHGAMGDRASQAQGSGPGDGLFLSGHKAALAWADAATHALVSARADDGSLSLWWVPLDAPGVTRRVRHGIDDTPGASLIFDRVRLDPADRLRCADDGSAPEAGSDPSVAAERALQAAWATAVACVAAEAVGTMASLHQQTLQYVKDRVQFGGPIGRFQAVQHRLVDMLVPIELSRSLAWVAMQDADAEAPPVGRLHAVKAQVAQACRHVAEQAVQLHGGMGMTDACRASHDVRRLVALEKLVGDRHHHLGRLVTALQAGDDATP